jgi:hypothetical protein
MNGLLFGTIAFLGMAAYALLTDTLLMRGRYERKEHPLLFWAGVSLYAGVGIAMLIMYGIYIAKGGK